MAVSLVGEIVNSCDAEVFNVGNISGDDDFVEGTGAIGLKIAASYAEIYTTTLGATAPYDFSSGGAEFGWHYILWFNTKLAIPTIGGLRCIFGNGTDRAEWNVDPVGFYKGGFLTKVISPERDFDTINAGTWTTGGNPAQLSNITTMGGGIETVPSIMGNFNSGQLDQMTIGLGLRVDAGTVGTPNTFEVVRAADEDTTFYGWWSSSNGAVVGKGKLFIGPSAGSTTSVFDDTAFVVIFADELVSEDFYEINTRGAGTDITWDLASISTANSDNVRWGLTVDSSTNLFSDKNGVWTGGGDFILDSSVGLTGTTIVDSNKLYQSGATLNGISVLAANTSAYTAFIESGNPEKIENSTFTFSTGHSIEITSQTVTAFTFSNNTFIDYGSDETDSSAIFNNSGGAIIINVTNNGTSPTIRNGDGASTTVNNTKTLTLTDLVDDTEVRIYSAGTGVELAGQESVTGGTFVYAYSYAADTLIDIVVFKEEYTFNEPDGRIKNFELPNGNSSIPINQNFDRNYYNP